MKRGRKRHNPASSASQYGAAQAVLSGASSLMPRKVARELIDSTPERLRQKFARELAARRRKNQSRFARCVASVGKRKGVRSAGGVCATIGRAKYGKKRFQAMAAAGRRKRNPRTVAVTMRETFMPPRGQVMLKDHRYFVTRAAADQLEARGLVRNLKYKTPRRRGNQETVDADLKAAERMYGSFHGRPARGHETVEQLRVLPSALADCGRMVELEVRRPGVRDTLEFNGTGVRVGTTGDGGQLYFVKGDQAIDLAGIPHKGKDHVDLGTAHRIVYLTSKDFHNFEPSEYVHRFGEEDGIRPTLHYDVRSKRLYLTGGNYQVKRAGIVN